MKTILISALTSSWRKNIWDSRLSLNISAARRNSRAFAERGSVVIMHSGSGDGMHAAGEYVVWQSVEQLAEIQRRFLQRLAENGF